MERTTGDLIFGITALIASVLIIIETFGYSFESSYFPLSLAALMAVLSAVYSVRIAHQIIRRRQDSRDVDCMKTEELRLQLKTAFQILVGAIAYTILIQIINYEAATFVFLMGLISLLEPKSYWRNLLVAMGLTVSLHAIFFWFLGVARPDSFIF